MNPPVQPGGWHVIGSANDAGTQVTIETVGPGNVIRVTVNYGSGDQTYVMPLPPQIPWVNVLPPASPLCSSDPCITVVGVSQAGASWSPTPGFTPGGMFCFPPPWNICIYFGTFCPSVSGPGTFGITLNNSGATDTEFVTVTPGPAVGPWPPITGICEGDDPFAVAPPLCAGSTSSFSGSGITPGGIFDPQAVGAGTHTIYYTCIDANGCSTTVSTTITLSPADWHHSTFNAGGMDEGIAVDVDQEGDIYVGGNHSNKTSINGVVNNASLPGGGVFLAKYDACGELEWAGGSGRFTSKLNDIAVDDLNDVVYAVGTVQDILADQFYSGHHNTYPGCGNTAFTTLGDIGFLAQWDKTTGCLNWVRSGLGTNTEVRAIDVDKNGNLFIGYQRGFTGTQVVGVAKFTFANAQAGPATWMYQSSLATAGDHTLNAIHVHDPIFLGGPRITITGGYDAAIQFPGAALHTNASGVMDCYVVRVNDGGAAPNYMWDQYANANTYAEGFDLDANFGGDIAVIGCFTIQISSSFNGLYSNFTAWPSGGFFGRLNGGTGVASYVCQIAPAGGGQARGTGIGVHGNYLYMTGSFRDFPLVLVCGAPFTPAPFVGTPGEDKTFIITADWNTGAWSSVSVTENGLAYANDLATDNNGFSYTTGAYSGTMDFQNSSPTLGSMTSSFGTYTNAFLLRGRPTTGLLERSGDFADGEDCSYAEGVRVCREGIAAGIHSDVSYSVSPNPGNGVARLSWKNGVDESEFTYQVMDATGKPVHAGDGAGASGEKEIDLRNQPAGMYFVRIMAGERICTIKLIKQ